MKKLLCILLAAVMLMSVFGILSFAGARPSEDPFSADEFVANDNLTEYVLAKKVFTGKNGKTTTTSYTYDDAGRLKTLKEGKETHIYSYDKSGNISKHVRKNGKSYIEETVYKYDGSGNILNSICNGYDSYDEYSKKSEPYDHEKNEYTYSKDLIKSHSVDGYYTITDDEEYCEDQYTYNSKSTYAYSDGLLVKVSEGKKKTTYQYDSKGRLISGEKVRFSSADYDWFSIERKYDKNGNLKYQALTEGYDNTNKSYYKYDNEGRLIKKRDGFRYFYTYDENGVLREIDSNLTTWIFNADGKISKITEVKDSFYNYAIDYVETYTYDKNGNNTKIVREYYDDGSTETTTLTYEKLSKPICVMDGKIRLNVYEVKYNGKARQPKVFIDGMKKGADYRVSYSNNVNPGKATITVTFVDPKIPPIKITFFIRPAKVTGLKVSSTAKTSATLTWNKTAKASKYAVYKYIDKTKEYIKVATVTTNKATIKNLKSATVYKFCVKAIGGGIYSKDYSAKVKAKTK